MAEEDLELAEAQKKPGGSTLKLIAIISVIVVLAVGAAVGTTLLLTGALSGSASEEEQEAPRETKGKTPKQANYMALEPPFVVNFEDEKAVRFLQISVEVMSRDAGALEDINLHMPAIRNELVILFSSQEAGAVGTREGKLRLREQTLAEINKILKRETGKAGIEAVYFTSFVMQ